MRNLNFALNKVDGHPRKDIFDCLTFNSFPLSHDSVLFCYIYRESYPAHIQGWNVYDPIEVNSYKEDSHRIIHILPGAEEVGPVAGSG